MVWFIYAGARALRDIITALKIPVSSSVFIGHLRMSITIFRSNYFNKKYIVSIKFKISQNQWHMSI